jgi:hypothetical protein
MWAMAMWVRRRVQQRVQRRVHRPRTWSMPAMSASMRRRRSRGRFFGPSGVATTKSPQDTADRSSECGGEEESRHGF